MLKISETRNVSGQVMIGEGENSKQVAYLNASVSTVASFRSSLWRMHRDFMAQGYITPDGLKTFLEMGKLYEKAGGNDIYHEKLLPDIESLEVRYTKDNVL